MQTSLQQTVGKNYADFWNTKKRYRVCKGSRGSKKSKTTALNMICRLIKYSLPGARRIFLLYDQSDADYPSFHGAEDPVQRAG